MPISVVRACLAQLPRLQAEESELASLRVAMGSGVLPKETRDQVHRGWDRQASRRRKAKITMAPDADFAALGIRVERVPATPPASVSDKS